MIILLNLPINNYNKWFYYSFVPILILESSQLFTYYGPCKAKTSLLSTSEMDRSRASTQKKFQID